MNLAARMLVLRAQRETRRAQRRRRQQLVRELATYCTPSQRDDLLATLDRYPDGQTGEMRDILATQSFQAQARTAGRPFR
jgi:hypothetical protein